MIQTIRDWLQQPLLLADALPYALMAAAFLLLLIGLARANHRSRTITTGTDAATKSVGLWSDIQDRIGLGPWPAWIVQLFFAIWLVLILSLLAGLLATIWSLSGLVLTGLTEDTVNDARLTLLGLAGLTAASGAVVALPFTLVRTRQNERQTNATEQGLVTDRINAAVESLGANKDVSTLMRSVRYKLDGQTHTEFEDRNTAFTPPENATDIERGDWQAIARTVPNTEVRVGAILALGRIARENLDFHVQVMQILCAYIREVSPASTAVALHLPDRPEDKSDRKAWATWRNEARNAVANFKASLETRTDIQTALETIGRRSPAQKRREAAWPDPSGEADCIFDTPFPEAPPYPKDPTPQNIKTWTERAEAFDKSAGDLRTQFQSCAAYRHDLRRCNLQGYDLQTLDLRGMQFDQSQMQGANLGDAKMQGASLWRVEMQGAFLFSATMRGANLAEAKMQEAVLGCAKMQGAILDGAKMQGAFSADAEMQGTILFHAEMQGAILGLAKMQRAILTGATMQGANLRRAKMQGASLRSAQMHGADLAEATMSDNTALTGAALRGAAVTAVNDMTISQLAPFWDVIFADGTIRPEDPNRPAHWATDELDYDPFDPTNSPFHQAWRAWAAEYHPDVPLAIN